MKEIATSKGCYAQVDDRDYESLSRYKWYPCLSTNTYYARGFVNGEYISMHKILMTPGPGLEVDHIDGNGLNNQRSNLRIVTHKENSKNRHPQASSEYEHIAKGEIKKHNTRAWRADPEDLALLKSLEAAKVEATETARVRAGLRALARENKVAV